MIPPSPAPVVLRTGCKVNFFLHVGEKQANGYHQVATYMLPLSHPFDTLEIKPDRHMPKGQCQVICSAPGIDPTNNTLTKAYALYTKATGFAPALRIALHKGVPHGAGLGGGSANAAAVLLHLHRAAAQAGLAVPEQKDLCALAAKVGADVPFFLENRPALATGIGEQLCPQPHPFAGWTLALVCPDISLSTARSYATLDAWREKNKKPEGNGLTFWPSQATTSFAQHGALAELFNDFETPVFLAYPQLRTIRDKLLEAGAKKALMSGSGSSLFGMFSQPFTQAQAEQYFPDCRTYVQTV